MSIRRWGLLAAVWFGCGDDGNVPRDAAIDAAVPDAAPDAPDPHQVVAEVPVTASNNNLDLLFVIDDSPSMADKQANLAANFPNFINVLSTAPGGLPNLHLGVVTTDVGTKGADDLTPGPAIGQIGNGGCSGTGKSGNLQTSGAQVTGTFISDRKQTDGTRIKNYTGTLDAVFGTMARVGAGGCGFEQPLEAMKRALNANPANAGFLRPDALLGVVLLTDEDDCSIKTSSMFGPESAALGALQSFRCTRFGVTCTGAGTTSDAMNQVGTKSGCAGSVGSTYMTDVAPYRDFLVALKGDPRGVVVAGIMGTATPFAVELRAPPGGGTAVQALSHSCTYTGTAGVEVADPPARLAAFVGAFPGASSFTSICQQDLSSGLSAIGQLLTLKLGSACLGVALADLDPVQPGPQVECFVDDIVGATVTPVPACGANPPPTCWTLQTDQLNCPLADHLRLVVSRAQAPDPATVTRMRCLVQ